MSEIAVKIPEEVMYDTKMNQEETSRLAKKYVALGYYLNNKVSIGYCAEIADMSEREFVDFLGENHVSIFRFGDESELDRDIENA